MAAATTLAGLAALLPAIVSADGNTGIVRGIVRFSNGGGACRMPVRLSSNREATTSALTDESGRYTFFGVLPGEVHVDFDGTGIGTRRASVAANHVTAVDVTVATHSEWERYRCARRWTYVPQRSFVK